MSDRNRNRTQRGRRGGERSRHSAGFGGFNKKNFKKNKIYNKREKGSFFRFQGTERK